MLVNPKDGVVLYCVVLVWCLKKNRLSRERVKLARRLDELLLLARHKLCEHFRAALLR